MTGGGASVTQNMTGGALGKYGGGGFVAAAPVTNSTVFQLCIHDIENVVLISVVVWPNSIACIS